MNTTDYWPFAREYLIWNASVAALQFWTADLESHVISSTIEQVYNVILYTTSMHLLCQHSEEVSFSCFVTMLNAAFENKLALEDEGYVSGSEKILSDELPEYTMFPGMTTSPLIPLLHCLQAWTIKESIYIRVNNPTSNQNIGKYNLSHIWDRVLFNTPGLKLSSSHNQQLNSS